MEESSKKTILERIQRGEFLVSVQIDPPGAANSEKFMGMIDDLIKAGVRLVDINSSRRISHDSIQLASWLSQKGLEVIPHVTTRDSSLNGLVNQILAAYDLSNVRNFLVITGDPYEGSQAIVPFEGVFQTDAAGALRAFDTHLRKNSALRRNLIFAAAVNQNEPDLKKEGERLKEKEEAGADFFMSQPVFSQEQILGLLDFFRTYSEKPLLIGIWPVMHWKTIEVISSGKVVGVILPSRICEEAAVFRENENELQKWALARAERLIEFLRGLGRAQGVYIVAPLRNPLFLRELIIKK